MSLKQPKNESFFSEMLNQMDDIATLAIESYKIAYRHCEGDSTLTFKIIEDLIASYELSKRELVDRVEQEAGIRIESLLKARIIRNPNKFKGMGINIHFKLLLEETIKLISENRYDPENIEKIVNRFEELIENALKEITKLSSESVDLKGIKEGFCES